MIAAIVSYQHVDAPAPPITTRPPMWYMEVGGSLHTMVANIGRRPHVSSSAVEEDTRVCT